MKRILQTIFLSLFLLLQLLLPFVQAAVMQSTAQSETLSLEASEQVDQSSLSVVTSPSSVCLVCCVRQRSILTEHFAKDFVHDAHLTPPNRGYLPSLSAYDVSIWPHAPPYRSVV